MVELINVENNNIRLEIVKNRYSNTLKTIVEKYVGGHCGHGLDSTRRIESMWSEIKAYLKKFIQQLDKRIFYIFKKNGIQALYKIFK